VDVALFVTASTQIEIFPHPKTDRPDRVVFTGDNGKFHKQEYCTIMNKIISMLCIVAASCIASSSSALSQTVMVGGEPMYPMKNIVENAMHSADHTTLVAAVKAGGLVETLEGKGPFTVFAPTNEAFAALPDGTVATLLKPDNRSTLVKILTYHVVPGKLDFNAIATMIEQGKGSATLKTVSGGTLTAMMNGKHNILIKDEKGAVAHISTYDVYQSNGVIHVVDSVLMPN